MIYDTLTRREKEVIDYVILGLTNDEIARLLLVSEKRIVYVMCCLYDKYNIDGGFHIKRCKLMKARLEELGIDFNKLTA